MRYLKGMGLLLFSYTPSFLKIFFYRMMGAKIGEGVQIGLGSYIIPYYSGFDKIRIGDNTVLEEHVRIIAKEVVIGNNVRIKENTSITGETRLVMGDHSYIDQNVIINLRRDVEIGVESGIGANSCLYTHGVWLPALDGAPVKFGKIVLKDRVWVSANVFIMPGITIGENAVVSSCAVVTKNVPENTFVAGNPAKEIRKSDPSKKPDADEKNRIVIDMVQEFIERFSERITGLETTSDSAKFHIRFDRRTRGLLPKKERYFIAYSKEVSSNYLNGLTKPNDEKMILLSLSFGKGLKEACRKEGKSWIDFGERTYNLDSSTVSSLLMKSFRNNGLRFNPYSSR